MGRDKAAAYDGYRPYDYLEAGVDYEPFEFQDGPHAFDAPYEVPLADDAAARADRLADGLVVSLHEHGYYVPADVTELFEYASQGRAWTAYEAFARGPLDAFFDFHFDGLARMHSKSGWKWTEIVEDLGLRAADLAQQDFVIRAGSVEDIERAHAEGKVAMVPAMEGATMIENELDRIDVLYGLGVRLMGVTYRPTNALGTGESDEEAGGGLTGFGHEAVERMNKLGMLVSVSHAAERTAVDVCEASDDPVLLPHNGARSVLDVDRNVADHVFEAVADTGGVIGVMASPHITASTDHPRHTIESVMDHFEYLVDLVGIDHVTFGPDTIFGDHAGMHEQFFTGPEGAPPEWHPALEQVDYVEGMENAPEAWHNIVRWLVGAGYDDDAIRKVVSGNVMRVLRTAW